MVFDKSIEIFETREATRTGVEQMREPRPVSWSVAGILIDSVERVEERKPEHDSHLKLIILHLPLSVHARKWIS